VLYHIALGHHAEALDDISSNLNAANLVFLGLRSPGLL
jgi:hypothetical protein